MSASQPSLSARTRDGRARSTGPGWCAPRPPRVADCEASRRRPTRSSAERRQSSFGRSRRSFSSSASALPPPPQKAPVTGVRAGPSHQHAGRSHRPAPSSERREVCGARIRDPHRGGGGRRPRASRLASPESLGGTFRGVEARPTWGARPRRLLGGRAGDRSPTARPWRSPASRGTCLERRTIRHTGTRNATERDGGDRHSRAVQVASRGHS